MCFIIPLAHYLMQFSRIIENGCSDRVEINNN
jgi:hypothetical protein